MSDPFDVFFKKANPDRCQLCCTDRGEIHGHGSFMAIMMKC
ncbi:hypothetical protein LCGC14_1825800, partial [marine sediment metagenome]